LSKKQSSPNKTTMLAFAQKRKFVPLMESDFLLSNYLFYDYLSVLKSIKKKRRGNALLKIFAVFPSPAGMSLTKLSLAGNN
jgi:hypothetical protein